MISDGDKCIVGYGDSFKIFEVKKGKNVKYNKHTFSWDSCIGKSYG